jgi:hypothetical protein
MKPATHSIVLAIALAAAACGKKEEPAPVTTMAAAEPAPMPNASGSHEGHDMPKAASVEYAAPTVPGKVFFDGTKDGDTVKGPEADGKIAVMVKMGVEGLTIKPAGALESGTGHHHIVIDAPGAAEGTVVPADASHLHFGKGQTEATLQLTPGEHSLTLQFADGFHRSYGPAWSSTIKVKVAAASK